MDKKAYLFAMYEILQAESDADHPLPAANIIRKLESQYGISIGIKKFYGAIRAMSEMFEISTYLDNRKGYYLVDRPFEKSEILHLCHAVHSTNTMTPKQIEELEEKLLSYLSLHQKEEYRESVHLNNPKNAGSAECLYTMDMISEAIHQRRWIRFAYGHYDINKKLVFRKEPYFREPRFIAFDNMHSYLISTDDHHNEPSHFRIDKIHELKVLEKEVKTTFSKDEAYEYAARKLNMFAGEEIHAEFKCRITPTVFDLMIDEFGKAVTFKPIPDDDHHFILSINAPYKGLIIFTQRYADLLEPLLPQKLVDQFKKTSQ